MCRWAQEDTGASEGMLATLKSARNLQNFKRNKESYKSNLKDSQNPITLMVDGKTINNESSKTKRIM